MRCLQTRNYIVFSIFSRDFKARAEIAYGSGNPGHVEESGGLGFHVLFPLQRCPCRRLSGASPAGMLSPSGKRFFGTEPPNSALPL